MTVGISTVNLANAWLNTLRGGGAGITFNAPAALYVAVHIADPGTAGTTGPSVGSATRIVTTLAAAAVGTNTISGTLPVWTNGGTTETLTHISVWSALTAGTFYFSALLTSSQPWALGNTFTLNSLGLSLAPLAA